MFDDANPTATPHGLQTHQVYFTTLGDGVRHANAGRDVEGQEVRFIPQRTTRGRFPSPFDMGVKDHSRSTRETRPICLNI